MSYKTTIYILIVFILTECAEILLFVQELLFFCSRKSNDVKKRKRVIVIGAGVSGLSAAKKLKDNGFNVLVLEAGKKIGGRTGTNRSMDGIAFDVGASWIHGVKGNPITNLSRQAGMQTVLMNDDNIVSYDIGGARRKDVVFSREMEKFYKAYDKLYRCGSATKSFEYVFNTLHPSNANDRLWKYFLSAYVTFDLGDLSKLSSLHYNGGEEFNGKEKFSTNGYDNISMFLAKDLDVKLKQRVVAIDYTESTIKVAHEGTFSVADYVLVTVPLGVLKAGKIQFNPSLPEKKQIAIEKIGMNCVNKFLLIWETAFWGNQQYITYTPEIRDKFNFFVNFKLFNPSVNALMTFAYADYARKTEDMSDEEVIQEIMKHLRDMYGRKIPNPMKMLRTKWKQNENAFGSYSYPIVGTEMSHYDDMAEDLSGKLFFAGEHTNSHYFATVHGAHLSGIREADKIIKASLVKE